MGRWLNNRVENSHLPIRRKERVMRRFRRMKTLQKFSSVHAQVYNHFNRERHLVIRQEYKRRRSAALAEWQNLMARDDAGESRTPPIRGEFTSD
ncbi:MAG: DDE-type integrase/transposase/recombinase [Chakrabartia sp.]